MNKLAIVGLVLGGVFLSVRNKVMKIVNDYENALKSLKIKLNTIEDLNISSSNLTGRVTLNITNPTTTDLGLDINSFVVLRKLFFYTQSGLYIGDATPNISRVSLPANTTIQTSTIPVIVPLDVNAINVGFELLLNSSNLKVTAEIEAFNTTYIIE